jgi:PAS domain S-box-containing protein
MLGYDREEIEPHLSSWERLVHPDDAPAAMAAVQAHLDGATPIYAAEHRLRHRDGRWVWVLDTGRIIARDDQGRPIRVCGIHLDITDRKQAEEALRASEERFRILTDHATDAIMLHAAGGEGTVLDANRGACEALGYDRDELIGMCPGDFDPLISDDRLVGLMDRLRDGHSVSFDTVHRRKDGSTFPVEVRIRPFRVDDQPFALSIARDITERNRAEEATRESHKFITELTALMPSVLYVFDLQERRNVYINRNVSLQVGYEEQDILALGDGVIAALMHPDDHPRFEEHLRAVASLADGESASFEYRLRHRDGTYRWFSSLVAPFRRDEGGRVREVLGIATDITERKRAEEALRVNEERYRLALEGAGLGTWDWHVLSGAAVFDDRWAGMLGFERHEVEPNVGGWERLLHPDDAPVVRAALVPHLDGSSPLYAVEFRLRHKIGCWIWVLATGRVIERDELGGPVRMCGIHQDVTDRKQAEEALRESESRLRVALEAAGAIAFVWDAQADRVIRYYSNDPTFPPNVDQPEPLAEVRGRIVPEDRSAFDAEVASCLAAGSEYRNLYRVARPDGSIGWLEEWGHLERDPQGAPVRLIGVSIDVTDRKRIEAEILALNTDLERRVAERTEDVRRLATIIDSSTDFVAIASPEGAPLWENRAFRQATGLPPDLPLRPGSVEVFHPPETARRLLGEAFPAADRDGHWVGETEVCSADGRIIPVSQLILSHRGADGRVEYRSTIMRDITDRKQLERTLAERSEQLSLANAELERASRLKDEFLASMSHELRTPLNGVLGLSEAIQERVYGPVTAEQVDALEDVIRSGRHLLSLINDILDLSKIEAGRMELEPWPTSVEDLCESCLRMVKELALRKRQHLSVAIRGVDAPAVLDERRAKQILVNLLGNAVKFTPEGGSIALEVEGDRRLGELRLRVRDTGIGIPPEDQEAIFQPFRQLDSRLSRAYAGTGLGLTLVRRMAEMHGGEVSVDSMPGQGSRFTVRLPWVLPDEVDRDDPGDADAGPDADADAGGDDPSRRPLVLLAEDHEVNARMVQEYLQAVGFEVAIAEDGEAALRMAEELRPAAIVMDIQMPKLDGIEAIGRLRADPRWRAVPILATTALAMPGDRERCEQAGADAYLPKPVPLAALAEMLRDRLGLGLAPPGSSGPG